MERHPKSNDNERVQINQEVYEGLEIIRQSGATNMLDRPMVIHLAREWELEATANWLESTDTKTYAELIFRGPEVIEGETLDQKLDRMDREYDEERRAFWEDESDGTT